VTGFWALIAAAYLLGSVPCGLLIGRLAVDRDVRKSGSGNIGATNVARTAGKAWGIVTLLADGLKGAAPVWTALEAWPGQPELAHWVGLAVMIGHCYPLYLAFRGGKGVATALGVFLVLAPKAVAAGVAVFVLAVVLTRRVSVGSLLAVLAVFGVIWYLGARGSALAASGLMILLIFIRHWANILRLARGEESRFSFGSG